MPKHNNDAFFMVWSPQGRAPTVTHDERESAMQEARRLSEANPGREFFVLRAVAGFSAPEPKAERIPLSAIKDAQIPF